MADDLDDDGGGLDDGSPIGPPIGDVRWDDFCAVLGYFGITESSDPEATTEIDGQSVTVWFTVTNGKLNLVSIVDASEIGAVEFSTVAEICEDFRIPQKHFYQALDEIIAARGVERSTWAPPSEDWESGD